MKLAEGKWQIEERSGGGGSVGSLPVPGWLAWAVWRWPYMFFMELPWHGLSCWCTFFSSEWHMSSVTTNIHIRVRHQSQCHWKMPRVVLNLKWPCFIEAAPMKLNERRNENAHWRLYIKTADQQNKSLQSFILYMGEITKLGRNPTVLDFFNTSFTRVSCALLLQSYFRQWKAFYAFVSWRLSSLIELI